MNQTKRIRFLLITFLFFISSFFLSCSLSPVSYEEEQKNFEDLLSNLKWQNSGHYLNTQYFPQSYYQDTIYKLKEESTIVQHFDFYEAIKVPNGYAKGKLLYTLDIYFAYKISNYVGENTYIVDFYSQSYEYKKDGNIIAPPNIYFTPKNKLSSNQIQFGTSTTSKRLLGIRYKRNEKYDIYEIKDFI